MTETRVDSIVIGGGIVGAATAYHLVRQGAKTLLLDRHDPGRATDAGAGILAPEASDAKSEAWFDFAVEAVGYYPTLIEQLQQEQEGDTGYAGCGRLTIAVSKDELERFEAARELIFARQKRRGLPKPDDLHDLASDEAQRLFPPLAPVLGAIYYRRAARVDGRLLAQALCRAAERQGLSIKQADVERLIVQPARLEGANLKKRAVTGVVVDGESIEAGNVVIAGGAWSHAFGEQLGLPLPVEPQRGQIIHLHLPDTDTTTWPMISAFRGHYMVPWPDQRVVVGATREDETGFQPYPTAAGIQEVLSEALRVAPGLAQARLQEIRVGLRPQTVDRLPILGPVPNIEHIYLATGHGPTGLQLGPYSGKLIADMISGQRLETDISSFEVARFKSLV
jgi:D-amino-acid dehydrogenase